MMEDKKDMAKLSVEELMEIAKLPLKEKKNSNLTPIKQFIVGDNLENGTDKIPAGVVYCRYEKWALINNITPLTFRKFLSQFKNYYKKVLVSNKAYYLLSPKGFDLSLQNIAQTTEKLAPKKRNSSGKKGKKASV